MTLRWPPKDPDEVLDYVIDWSERLAGDTIVQSSWTADAGVTVDNDTLAASATTVWLSGGTEAEQYTLTNSVVTAAGRTMEQSVKLRIKSR